MHTSLSFHAPLSGYALFLRVFRSVCRWFDEEGRIVNQRFFADVKTLHVDISKEKKNI